MADALTVGSLDVGVVLTGAQVAATILADTAIADEDLEVILAGPTDIRIAVTVKLMDAVEEIRQYLDALDLAVTALGATAEE